MRHADADIIGSHSIILMKRLALQSQLDACRAGAVIISLAADSPVLPAQPIPAICCVRLVERLSQPTLIRFALSRRACTAWLTACFNSMPPPTARIVSWLLEVNGGPFQGSRRHL